MAKDTSISWTNHTWNPWWGCQKVSPACTHCYAETWALRCGWNGKPGAKGITKPEIWGGSSSPRRFFGDAHWRAPLKWNADAALEMSAGRLKPGSLDRPRVFCASMADWLEDREDLTPHLARLLQLIHATPNLDWLMLSKRPEVWRKRMHDVTAHIAARAPFSLLNAWRMVEAWLAGPAPANVWMGTTVEDQKHADSRIQALLDIPAGRRFLSMEPLLEPVSFRPAYGTAAALVDGIERGDAMHPALLDGIQWVIVGGESGKCGERRPFEVEWLQGIANQCDAAGVALHVKQDAGAKSGLQGRIPDALWKRKEFPKLATA